MEPQAVGLIVFFLVAPVVLYGSGLLADVLLRTARGTAIRQRISHPGTYIADRRRKKQEALLNAEKQRRSEAQWDIEQYYQARTRQRLASAKQWDEEFAALDPSTPPFQTPSMLSVNETRELYLHIQQHQAEQLFYEKIYKAHRQRRVS